MPLPIFCSTPDQLEQANALAQQHGFVLVDTLPASGNALVLSAEHLALHTLGKAAPGPVWVDFAAGAADWRRKHGGGRGQGVAKACGLKAGSTPHVLDATSGLGGDAFVLASLGCKVDLVERSPVAAALLQDGLQRASRADDVAAVVARMTLHHANAIDLLANWPSSPPEVIYLDPMFPEKNKSALAKKAMQAFQTIIGGDSDADDLLLLARRLATRRVAVKRPRIAPWLAGEKPAFSLEGESVRFDVYLPLPVS